MLWILNFITNNIILLLLIIYIVVMKQIENDNRQLWVDAIIAVCISAFSVTLMNNRVIKDIEILRSYDTIFYPLFFTVLIFVLNFYSSHFLGKPFSFYFSKSMKNLGYLLLPLIVRILLIFFGFKITKDYILIYFTDIFYTIFMFTLLLDVYRWNKSEYIKKFQDVYTDALVELPFDETLDNVLYYQWQSFLDNNTSESTVHYKEIYIRRLNRLSSLKKTINRLKLDQFTMRMIELSVTEQNEITIQLSDNNEYNYYKDFLSKTSEKFLYELLTTPNFKFTELNEVNSFSLILNEYIKKEKLTDSGNFLRSMISQARSDDLGTLTIKKELYLALYKNNKFDNTLKYIKYEKDIEDIIIIDAIIQKHNQLIKKDNLVSSGAVSTKEYESIGPRGRYRAVYDETLYNDYEHFQDTMDNYNKLFSEVINIVYFSFEFDGAISGPILRSNIVKYYYENYYNTILKKLRFSSIENTQISHEINVLLNLAHTLFFVLEKERKNELIKDVNDILMHYSEKLFDNKDSWSQINYLKENYTVINGLLNEKVRGKIKESIDKFGGYKIPMISELKASKTFEEKEEIIVNFYNTYEEQFNNDEWYILFEENPLVKNKYIGKVKLYEIFIANLVEEKNKSHFLDDLYGFKDFNVALGRLWVFNKNKYNALVKKEKPIVLLGVYEELKIIEKNKDVDKVVESIEKIGLNNLRYFISLFENVQVVKTLEIPAYMSIEYIEELGLTYTIKNFDEEALKEASTDWLYFISKMSKPIDFIVDLIDSVYMECIELDCQLFYVINNILNSSRIDNNKRASILEKLIEMISQKRVVNNKYKASSVFEYDVIIMSYNSIQDDKSKELFMKKILSNVEPYFISELLDEKSSHKIGEEV